MWRLLKHSIIIQLISTLTLKSTDYQLFAPHSPPILTTPHVSTSFVQCPLPHFSISHVTCCVSVRFVSLPSAVIFSQITFPVVTFTIISNAQVSHHITDFRDIAHASHCCILYFPSDRESFKGSTVIRLLRSP